MALQGSSYNLQSGGGTGIYFSHPQNAGPINLQGGNTKLQGGNVQIQGPGALSSGQIAIGGGKAAVNQAQSVLDKSQSDYNALLAEIRALKSQAYAPPINLAAINAQARQQAEAAVNPLYTKKLNDFLTREAVKRSRAQEDYSTSLTNAADILKNTLEGNTIQRGRTTEDTAQNVADINAEADRSQTQGGQSYDLQRVAEAQKLADAGLVGSGLGAQASITSQANRNTAEQQQGEDFQNKRVAQAVLKSRNFEDLGRSDVLAQKQEGKSKEAAKVDLSRLIADVDYETEQQRQLLEGQRYIDLNASTQSYGKALINNFIASIANPAQRQAAAQAYGSFY